MLRAYVHLNRFYMKTCKTGLMLFGLLLGIAPLWGQEYQTENLLTDTFETQMARLLEHVTPAQVPSGLLLDRSVQLGPLEKYNGSTEAFPCSPFNWRMAYLSLYWAQLDGTAVLPDPEATFTAIDSLLAQSNTAGEVPMGILHLRTHRFRADAESNGDVQIIDGQIHLTPDGDAFEAVEVFAMAPLIKQVHGPDVAFTLPEAYTFSNVSPVSGEMRIQSLRIDAGDGNGYREVALDPDGSNHLKSNYHIHYEGTGIKELHFRVEVEGSAKVYYGHSTLEVLPPLSADLRLPDRVFPAKPGVHDGGSLSIELGCANAGGITKPLIVVEGFEPSSELGLKLGDFLEKYQEVEIVGADKTLYELLQINNYDIIYLNYNNGAADIRRNARLLQEVIRWVNHQKALTGSGEPNIVIGESMGGLVARYALREMELLGEDHETGRYISFDTPHNGANVPVGMQALLAELFEMRIYGKRVRSLVPQLHEGMDILNSAAARQMLIYRPDNYSTVATSLYQDFYGEINASGFGFPRQTVENICISNGSQDGNFLGDFNAGAALVDFRLTRGDLINQHVSSDLFSGFLKFLSVALGFYGEVKVKVNAAPAYSSGTFKEVMHFKAFTTIFNIPILLKHGKFKVRGVHPLDNSPGGFYQTATFMGTAELEEMNVPGLSDGILHDRFSFIPATSSTALLPPNDIVPGYNMRTSDPVAINATLADALTGPEYPTFTAGIHNESHVDLSLGTGHYLSDRLISVFTAPTLQVRVLDPANSFNHGRDGSNDALFSGELWYNTRVEAQAYLGVNAFKPVGKPGDNLGFPVEFNEEVNVAPGECGLPKVTVEIENGGQLLIGSTGVGLSGTMNFRENSELILRAGCELHVARYSRLTVEAGATLQMEPGSRIVIDPNGSVVINGTLVKPLNGQPLTIEGGGSLYVNGSNRVVFDANNGLSVNNNSRVYIGSAATLAYAAGTSVDLNGNQSQLVIRGSVELGDNATFTYGFDDPANAGFLVFDPAVKDQAIVAGPGSRFELPRLGSGKKTMEVRKDTRFEVNSLTGEYLDELVFNDTRIDIWPSAHLLLSMPLLNLVSSHVRGGKLSIYRPQVNATDGSYYHLIAQTTFDGVTVDNAPWYIAEGEALAFSGCHFTNEALYVDMQSAGATLENCTFENSGVQVYQSRNTRVAGCTFSGRNMQGSAISISKGFGPVILENNRIEDYRAGVSNGNLSDVFLSCNEITGNYTGIFQTTLADAYMDALSGGQNRVVDNGYSNVDFLGGNAISFNGGQNALFNGTANGYVFSGVIYGGPYSCSGEDEYYPAQMNQWSETTPATAPADLPAARFDLEFVNVENDCDKCNAVVLDQLPGNVPACDDPDEEDPLDPVLDPILSVVGLKNGGATGSLQRCPTCPVIVTDYFQGVPLVEAVAFAASQSTAKSGNNDRWSLELMSQILSHPYPVKTEELYRVLNTAYQYAKWSAGKLITAGEPGFVLEQMATVYTAFDPVAYASVPESAGIAIEIDRATLLRMADKRSDALKALEALQPQLDADETGLSQLVSQEIDLLNKETDRLEGNLSSGDFEDYLAGLMVGGGPLDILLDPDCIGYMKQPVTAMHGETTDHTTGIAADLHASTAAGSFGAFPNPFTDAIQLQLPDGWRGTVRLQDITGRVVHQSVVQQEDQPAIRGLEGLTPGPYLVHFEHAVHGIQYVQLLIRR